MAPKPGFDIGVYPSPKSRPRRQYEHHRNMNRDVYYEHIMSHFRDMRFSHTEALGILYEIIGKMDNDDMVVFLSEFAMVYRNALDNLPISELHRILDRRKYEEEKIKLKRKPIQIEDFITKKDIEL